MFGAKVAGRTSRPGSVRWWGYRWERTRPPHADAVSDEARGLSRIKVCHLPPPLALAPPHSTPVPPQATRLDPRGAYRPRSQPCPHRSRRAMHPRSPQRAAAPPLSLAPPAPSRPLPSWSETRPLLPIRHPSPARARARPPFLSPGHPARSPVAAGSSPSAPWTRQTARAGGLVSTLTPRRAVRRRSSNLSG